MKHLLVKCQGVRIPDEPQGHRDPIRCKKEMPDDGGLGNSVAYDYQYNKFQEFRRQFPGVWAILFEIC